jgi:hypothetical protein
MEERSDAAIQSFHYIFHLFENVKHFSHLFGKYISKIPIMSFLRLSVIPAKAGIHPSVSLRAPLKAIINSIGNARENSIAISIK